MELTRKNLQKLVEGAIRVAIQGNGAAAQGQSTEAAAMVVGSVAAALLTAALKGYDGATITQILLEGKYYV